MGKATPQVANQRVGEIDKTESNAAAVHQLAGKDEERYGEERKLIDAREGPLDDRTVRLVKLAFAMGAHLEGAVHANVRKAVAAGITPEEIYQVVGMAAGSLCLPSTVAVYTWVQDILGTET